jgi:hypothetical protein
MQPAGAMPFQPPLAQSMDDVVGLEDDPLVMETAPRMETIAGGGAPSAPVPTAAAGASMPPETSDEKKKIMAIPKHDGRGMTTTTLKSAGGVEFEEDEEPTRALDEEAAALDDAMRIDTSGLVDTGEPVFSDTPLKKKGAAAAAGQVQAARGQATPPGAVPYPAPPAEMMGAFPHGTVAIGPDGQPVFVPFIPQRQGALSPAMKWVLVMAITMILMVIGGVVVYILVIQTKARAGGGRETAGLEMDENQGAVLLRVFPSTANVRVRGEEIPREKLSEPIIVPAKVPFEVEVWQDGYKREKFTLLVSPKDTITKEVALQELQGRVIVNSVPDKAEVYVGGQLKGETPATIEEFPINERVTITVKKRDFELWSEVVELNEEKTERTLVAILQKAGKKGKEIIPIVASKEKETSVKPGKGAGGEPAKEKVKKDTGSSKKKEKETSASPTTTGGGKGGEGFFIALTKPWAKVLINGKDTGRKTPIVPTNPIKLSPGSYKVTFVLPTGESFNFNIKIKAGEQTKLIKNFEQ